MPAVVCLMGPTAAGKTALALALQRALDCEIVSADSGMVYRGLDIGTAKPSAEVLRRVPHHLVDVCEPEQSYSTGRFRRDALAAIGAIQARGRLPLLVGGTRLYFRALMAGLSRLPPAHPEIRARLAEEAAAQGWEALHARLERIDPAAAARIHPRDSRRIQRALEVWQLTGQPMSLLWRADRPQLPPFDCIRWVLAPAERAVLHHRIEQRFDAMLERGLVREVEALRARPGLHADTPAMRLVGYRQAWRYLNGACDTAEMRRAAVASSRRLARQQLVWLRAEQDAQWLDSTAPRAAARLLQALQRDPRLTPHT